MWEGAGVAFYQHSFNFRNMKVLNGTSYFPAPGRERDASNLQRPHEFNSNLLAGSQGCLGWMEGEQWGYGMVQLIWIGGFF